MKGEISKYVVVKNLKVLPLKKGNELFVAGKKKNINFYEWLNTHKYLLGKFDFLVRIAPKNTAPRLWIVK